MILDFSKYAKINKETFSYICEKSEVTSEFLAQKTHIPQKKIDQFKIPENNIYPTIRQAKKLAKILLLPFAALYLKKENIDPKFFGKKINLKKRTIANGISIDKNSLNLVSIELIRAKEFLLATENDFLLPHCKLSLPKIPNHITDSEFARLIRDFFELKIEDQFQLTSDRQFYLYVRNKIENKGIFVQCFTIPKVEELRGLSIYDEHMPIIGINFRDSSSAKTFSIIHELVHILRYDSTFSTNFDLSDSSQFDQSSVHDSESYCNKISGEVLVPTNELEKFLQNSKINKITMPYINKIHDKFHVSKEAICRRLLNTKHINHDDFERFTKFLNNSHKEKASPSEQKKLIRNLIRETIDKNSPSLSKILLYGFSEGYFNEIDLSRLLNIKDTHVIPIINEIEKL
ncbi:MAG: ImmA/IrrE family metallo-endopeptidase [Deltaproteobacteria bacterium]|jgi:Zn-dependent peptidase ImmA (M78 family)|nr:ImmA/IrrE family metallo-endopeptidase [Deltaproteobacteria bacterium]